MNVKFEQTPNFKSVEVYVDGTLIDTKPVCTNKDGKQYIYVPNVYRPDGDILSRHSFLHRPGDMVRAIKDGLGDCIEVGTLMVRTEHLVRFLDREYGEEMRAKSLEGWKDAKFGWIVCEKCGFLGNIPLTVAGIARPSYYKADARMYPIKFYDTEAEAQSFIDELKSELMPKIEAYRSLATVKAKNTYYEKELRQYTGIKESVILRTADDGDIPLHVQQVVRTTASAKATIHVVEGTLTAHCYLCRGDAIDSCEQPQTPTTGQLYLHRTVADLFKHMDRCYIYRLVAGELKTSWYTDLQNIFDSNEYPALLQYVEAENCDCVSIEEGILHQQKLFPIIPTQEEPFETIANEGERGLVVFANLNPDEVGTHSTRRKVYFPDRSCAKKICAGKVRITGIKDMGRYGFFTGEMVPYEAPSEEDLAIWLLDNSKFDVTIQFRNNPLWGSCIRIQSPHSSVETYCSKDSNGELTTFNLLDLYDHQKDEVVEEISAKDFLCTGYAGATMEELCSIVPHVNNLPSSTTEKTSRFLGEDFDTAIDCGLIYLWKAHSVHFCSLNPDKMPEAASILKDRLISVLEKAAEINQNAMVRFAAQQKKK